MHQPTDLQRVIDAVAFAAEAHRHQRRKDVDASPYINHPLALMRILLLEGGVDDADVLCAAALHDYLEDCCGQAGQPSLDDGRALVGERFGPQVLAYVDAVTDDKTLEKAERKRQQVEHAGHAPDGAKLVKLADKIANLRDLAQSPPAAWEPARRRAYFDWAAQVVDRVRGVHPQLEVAFDAALAQRPA
ncbi:metal dependent phosphohydrolase [Pseudoxanthomonas sp. GM95]|uniref:HD domain-containing protein n=1 Tax=Pseudoxanthomonas sp. GM95 TaxID=1881043 RepID=UPI0008B46E37|nr:HD domain-containing protein [Pseudoxanthomonas sp. GM95]SEL84920.1 metal dependent phosphohydrolase [Pseudoxanthomonas sp. GM95]